MGAETLWPAQLVDWYRGNALSYPWRDDPTPYHVWLSEIMLQQTRLETVRPYYQRFTEALPDIASLAAAPEEEVLKLWEGLGYYSRARNLQKAARMLVSDYGGSFPADFEAVRRLPGIGDYTAGAICAVAFGLPVPAVDGNVLRVVSRLYELRDDVLTPAARKKVTELLKACSPADDGRLPSVPSAFVQGLMELGETLCLPHNPSCDACPLQTACLAFAHGSAETLPVRSIRSSKKEETRSLLLIEEEGRILLHRRPPKGVLAGLWELPAEEDGLICAVRGEKLAEARHIFTHLIWNMTLYEAALLAPLPEDPDFYFASPEELRSELMLPTAFTKILAKLKEENP